MTATGVASPSAQGQEITKTLIAIFSAREICTFPPAAPMTTQTMSVTSAMRRTTGTNTPAILSTVRSMGALLAPALRTSLMILEKMCIRDRYVPLDGLFAEETLTTEPALLSFDSVHPTELGNEKIARWWLERVRFEV